MLPFRALRTVCYHRDRRGTDQEPLLLHTPPPHEPGVLPKWLHEKGANVIIAGGMGARAQQFFTEMGIKVVIGAQSDSPEDLARKYMSNTLVTGANICDH